MAVATTFSTTSSAIVAKQQLAVERIADETVAHAQHLRHEPAQQADHQTAHRRLQPHRWTCGSGRKRLRSHSSSLTNATETNPPTTPSTA